MRGVMAAVGVFLIAAPPSDKEAGNDDPPGVKDRDSLLPASNLVHHQSEYVKVGDGLDEISPTPYWNGDRLTHYCADFMNLYIQ